MTCKDCEAAQERGACFPVRWGKANILVSGCIPCVKSMFEALREKVSE